MKRLSIFLPLLLVLACTTNSSQNTKNLVQANNMNLPQLEATEFDNVSFKLSKLFQNNLSYLSSGLTIQSNGYERSIYELGLYFSVESFDKNYINQIRFLSNDSLPDLDLIHEYYVKKRANTLSVQETSIRKKLSKSIGFKGYQQVVEGSSYDSYSSIKNTYFIASLEIDQKIFVFQFVGPQKNMGYFYDDFQRLLNSIEK